MSAREKLLKRVPKLLEPEGIYIRSLTIAEFLHVESIQADESKQLEFVGYVLSRAVTDEEGVPVFTGPDDPGIQDLPLELVSRLTTEITALSKTGKFSVTVKNSEATP